MLNLAGCTYITCTLHQHRHVLFGESIHQRCQRTRAPTNNSCQKYLQEYQQSLFQLLSIAMETISCKYPGKEIIVEEKRLFLVCTTSMYKMNHQYQHINDKCQDYELKTREKKIWKRVKHPFAKLSKQTPVSLPSDDGTPMIVNIAIRKHTSL